MSTPPPAPPLTPFASSAPPTPVRIAPRPISVPALASGPALAPQHISMHHSVPSPSASIHAQSRSSRTTGSSNSRGSQSPTGSKKHGHGHGSSESIRIHADLMMQIIRDQSALAVQTASAELEALKVELERMREELGEMEALRRENEELKEKIRGEDENGTAGNVNDGSAKNVEKTEEKDEEKEVLWKRCEELERENERLRKSEANLLQRVEIFESLNASTSATLESMETLPDLSGAVKMLKGHLSKSRSVSGSSQEDVQAKKRRLEESTGS